MKQVTSYEEFVPMLSAQLRRGVIANAPVSAEQWRREIAHGTLWVRQWDSGLLLLRRREGFDRLTFYLHALSLPDDLTWDHPVVLEIAARPRDTALLQAVDFWRGQGFQEQFQRERLTLPAGIRVPSGNGPLTARLAVPEDQPEIMGILVRNFPALTGCLPTADELAQDLQVGNVVCTAAPDGVVAGVLHITPGRPATQLRHLAVDKAYRRQGGAQGLLACYLEHTNFAKSQVWVRTDNRPARQFYETNGYTADGWRSTVLYRPNSEAGTEKRI